MKRFAALAVTSILALSACSGGGTTATHPVSAAAPTSTLTAYRVPLTHNAAVDAAFAASSASGKRGTSGLGGLPTVDLTVTLLDAPRFGAGAQINLAVLGVQAIGTDGVAYAIASYDSPVVINVLNYKTSALVLGHASVPAQSYKTLRLIVKSSASSVFAWGATYPVTYGYFDGTRTFTPAPDDVASVDFPITGTSSGSSAVIADFNAVESVKVKDGMAKIGSRIAAAPYNGSSVIDGTVVNKAGQPVSGAVVAVTAADGTVAATTITEDDGTFEIHAIVGGTYALTIHNDYITAAGDEIIAVGADSSSDVAGPQVAVPGGYKTQLGNLLD